ncbi:hypothetical protein [Rhodococcus globerulus]|uniref:hypothetical protein n=1 Tax=Rhodococcus globerulus TaxID=33008 RepID=UPI001F35D5B1|nr:hypothetical protein [Rhodococcus globerulus]MCE4267687.1 hypothetical protein [Rhodococcus globerulus]
MFAKIRRNRYVVTSHRSGTSTVLLDTTKPGDAQVAAQQARTSADRNERVRITHYLRNEELTFEELSPLNLSNLNDAEIGSEIVFDLLGQPAGMILPSGRQGWAITLSNPWTPPHMQTETLAPPKVSDRFHNTHHLARNQILQFWSESLDARVPAPEREDHYIDADFTRVIDAVRETICARATGTPLAETATLASTAILFGSKDGTTLEESSIPAHVVNPNALAQYLSEVAAAEHYSYLTALHGGVQRVLPSHTDHDASEYPANPTLVFISVGPGKTVANIAHLREHSGHLAVGSLLPVGLDDTQLTGAMDAATLAALERHF